MSRKAPIRRGIGLSAAVLISLWAHRVPTSWAGRIPRPYDQKVQQAKDANALLKCVMGQMGQRIPKASSARAVMPDPSGALTPFWLRNETVLVGPKGTRRPLTFAFDSELPTPDVFRALALSPQAMSEARRIFPTVPVEELTKVLGTSKKQLEGPLVLRRGVPRGLAQYSITDLNPYFAGVWLYQKIKAREFFPDSLPPLVLSALRKKGLPLKASLDVDDVEVQHQSWEFSPSQFKMDVNQLYKVLDNPQTHLRVGLPAEAIGREQAKAIGRAVETPIILNLIRDTISRDTKRQLQLGSPLAETYGRGVVALRYGEFPKPVRAHDLEIRQYPASDASQAEKYEGGMQLLSLAAQLAEKSDRLLTLGFKFGKIDDDARSFGNLRGALDYSRNLLARSASPERQAIAERILELLRSEPQNGQMSDAFLAKTQQLVIDTDLDQIMMDPELYLIH